MPIQQGVRDRQVKGGTYASKVVKTWRECAHHRSRPLVVGDVAMSDKKHRVILPEEEMDPLDSWDPVFLDREGCFGYRHRYSLAEEKTVAGLPSFDDLWAADNAAGVGDGVL